MRSRLFEAWWRRPWLAGWLVCSTILVPILSFRRQSEWTGCYAPAAKRIIAGLDLPGAEGWVYPPFFAVPVLPIVWLPTAVGRLAWCMLLVGAVILAVRWLWNALMLDEPFRMAVKRPLRFVVFVLLLGSTSVGHALVPLSYQSHDPIVLALIAGGAWFGAAAFRPLSDRLDPVREWSAGICFGLAASCKVMPVLFLPVMVAERRWRACWSMLLTGAMAALLFDACAWLLTGRVHLLKWLQLAAGGSDLMASGGGRWGAWNPLNQSGTGILTRLMVPTPTELGLGHECMILAVDDQWRRIVLLGWILVIVGTLTWVAFRTALGSMARQKRGGASTAIHSVAMAGATACAALLIAPHSSNYHFAPLCLAAAAMAAWLITRGLDATLVTCLVVMILIEAVPGRDLIGGRMADLKLAYGSVGLCALAAFIGALRIMSLASRPVDDDAVGRGGSDLSR
ncbi:MAG: DUF2029 domain-containing protein [Planctomycetes bacterium]|nr:DUF2029 domain-containing protein [Planctomycetota bacterium]